MAHEVSDRPLAREMDMLLSTGERISCALCAMAIHDMGHSAISLTGSQAGIVTDSSHTKARILDVRADRIREALGDDRIVLVAGFQGVSGDSRDVTTLGRGGSDTTAVAIAAALGADVCEIYTDVRGVFSADPRLVPDARLLRRRLVRGDARDGGLGRQGAAASLGRVRPKPRDPDPLPQFLRGWPRYPRRLGEGDDGETLGDSRDPRRRGARHPGRRTRRAGRGGADLRRPRRRQRERGHDHPERARVGRPEGRPLVHGRPAATCTTATEALDRLEICERLGTDERIGKVSIVGAGMRSHPGVAAKVFQTLGESGINIEMISTSPIKISCVIAADQVPAAVKALHQAFELGEDAIRREEPTGDRAPAGGPAGRGRGRDPR